MDSSEGATTSIRCVTVGEAGPEPAARVSLEGLGMDPPDGASVDAGPVPTDRPVAPDLEEDLDRSRSGAMGLALMGPASFECSVSVAEDFDGD